MPHCVSCVARWLTSLLTLTARREMKAKKTAELPPHLQPLVEPLMMAWWPKRKAAERARASRSTGS